MSRQTVLARRGVAAVFGGSVALISVFGLAFGAGVAGASKAPIKIGFITSNSGALGAQFVGVAADFKARIAYQNAHGGVNGHKLVVYVADDGSTAQGNLAAAQNLVGSKHVLLVAEETAFTVGSARYLHAQHVPVVGGDYSGPEWGQYSNLFGDWGREDPSAPAYTTIGLVFKKLGAKALGAVGFGPIASSHAGALNAAKAARAVGIKAVYVNTSVQPGSNDFSTQALGLKNAGADSIYAPLGIPGDIALVTAARNAGADIKYLDEDGGYAGIVGTSAQRYFENAAFSTYWTPEEFNTAATRAAQAALKRYGGLAKGRTTYNFDVVGWLSGTLAVTGLQHAGATPTAASTIAALRNLTGYDANGMLPAKIGFKGFVTATDVGANGCLFAVQLVGSKFVPMNGKKPFCGKKL
jgi:branched-chain amino acid transport system substrate-binding protein